VSRPYRHGDPRPPGAERVVRLREQREFVQMRVHLDRIYGAFQAPPEPVVIPRHSFDRPAPSPTTWVV
jgi:hypothetical protein